MLIYMLISGFWGNTVPQLSMPCNADLIPAGPGRWYVRYNLHEVDVVRTRQLDCLCHDFYSDFLSPHPSALSSKSIPQWRPTKTGLTDPRPSLMSAKDSAGGWKVIQIICLNI